MNRATVIAAATTAILSSAAHLYMSGNDTANVYPATVQCPTASADTQPWKGRLITREKYNSTPNSWLIFRKDFTVDTIPTTLPARIATDTKYWMWINGEAAVFEGGLKRGPSPHSTYYDTVDIAPFLKQGDNTIAILVWHMGRNGFSHLNSGTGGLIFDACAPGIEIVSDPTWRCAVHEAYGDTGEPYPNYRLPESNIRFDARLEPVGWQNPGYDGKLPVAVAVADANQGPWGELAARPIPQWKNSGLQDYESITRNGDTIVCTLPYNAQVTPWLKVNAPAGKTIGMMTDNYEGGSANNVRGEYITRDGQQEYESLGWINGHKVLYILPEDVEVIELKYRETGYNADIDGTFECDDPFLNELWKRSARTLYITMRDNYMDCPDRERAQWWGDEVNELGETFYTLTPSSWALARKGIYELVNWQRESGVFYSPVPSFNWGKELPLQMLASVGWYGFYTQYYYSADSTFVKDVYPAVKKYLHEVWQTDDEGLVINRAGDWNWADWGENSDLSLLTNCWYYLALKGERQFAAMLGLDEDVAVIDSMMNRIENAFDNRFWTGSEYRTPGYTGETDDRGNAMAVVSGLAVPERYPAIAKVLEREYHASPYMEKYVLEALCIMGKPQQAMDRMHTRYKKMLDYDYTTLFEGWGIGSEGFGGGTINHAWSGGPLTILSQKITGIEPTSPGFKTFSVQPAMGNLKHIKAAVPTAYGLIEIEANRSGNKIKLNLTVPDGTQATVDGKTLQPGTHQLKIAAAK